MVVLVVVMVVVVAGIFVVIFVVRASLRRRLYLIMCTLVESYFSPRVRLMFASCTTHAPSVVHTLNGSCRSGAMAEHVGTSGHLAVPRDHPMWIQAECVVLFTSECYVLNNNH